MSPVVRRRRSTFSINDWLTPKSAALARCEPSRWSHARRISVGGQGNKLSCRQAYLAALQRRGSPLCQVLAEHTA